MAGIHVVEKKEAKLPTFCPQNHASSPLPLKSRDILCVWFSGTQEGMADISIYLSRLKTGETEWSLPVKLSEDPAKSEQNPVLFMAPYGKLWLMWTSQKAGNQDTAEVRYFRFLPLIRNLQPESLNMLQTLRPSGGDLQSSQTTHSLTVTELCRI